MNKSRFFLAFVICTFLLAPGALAQDETAVRDEFYRATVVKIIDEGVGEVAGDMSPYQIVEVKLLNGPDKDKILKIEHGTDITLEDHQKVKKGEKIVVSKSGASAYYILETYRISPLIYAALIFLALSIFFGRTKGFTSILGMVFSFIIVAAYVIPAIAQGINPVLVSLSATFIIAFISLYVAHGFNKRTTIALISTLVTLVLAAVLATIFVSMAKLYGLGAEETVYLQWGNFAGLDFRGLLLGGIMIGALGVLDDITVGQVAVVHELRHANPSLSFKELFTRASRVGREHIASLVNTLVLAYTGASLPALILFTSESDLPLWVLINSEFIAEEIIRTLVGSTTLVAAVPITTFLACWFITRRKLRSEPSI